MRDFLHAATAFLSPANWGLRRWQRPAGLYEVLRYHAVLELLDPKGRSAIYERQQRVRFLQDCPVGFFDYGWGDGQAFVSHRVSPGRIVDRQPLGPRYRSLIALPSPKRRGETFRYAVRRRIEQGFRKPGEWWLEAEVNHPMARLSLAVIFPATRPAKRAWIISQRGPEQAPVDLKRCLPDGRQEVRYTVQQPAVGERYTLSWDW